MTIPFVVVDADVIFIDTKGQRHAGQIIGVADDQCWVGMPNLNAVDRVHARQVHDKDGLKFYYMAESTQKISSISAMPLGFANDNEAIHEQLVMWADTINLINPPA